MKKSIRILIPLFSAVCVLPWARADEPRHLRVLADANDPDNHPGHRFFIEHTGEKETVAFLGVETTPVPPVVTAQLGLPKDAGLVVRHVVPNSPAAGVLQVNDILLKLDDQLLIEPRQFAVLVRGHKEGDEVALTYYRTGKEATAKVKLTKHDVPKLAAMMPKGGEGRVAIMRRQHGDSPEEMDRVLALLDPEAGDRALPDLPAGGDEGISTLRVNPGNSNMVYSDDKGSLELTIKDGKKTLLAKNAKGDTLFSGPIDTPEQRKGLKPEIRERLEKIEGMDGFSFRTDDDFHANVKYQRVGTKISLQSADADDEPLDAPEGLREPPPPAY